jgi:hypothetical protein
MENEKVPIEKFLCLTAKSALGCRKMRALALRAFRGQNIFSCWIFHPKICLTRINALLIFKKK